MPPERIAMRQVRDVIGDPTYAGAILNRLVHNGHRVDLAGDSLRATRPRTRTRFVQGCCRPTIV